MDLLAVTRDALSAGPVCDGCLGRLVADRSHGLTNEQRGRALRTTVALADDDPFEATAPDDCWVCEGLCGTYDAWAERVVDALAGIEFETYQVGTRPPPLVEENDELLRADAGLDEDAGEPFKTSFNREVGRRVGEATGKDVDLERPDVLALLVPERETVEVQVNPAFVYGRYRKLERDIPQTEWPCSNCGGTGKAFDGEREVECPECDGTGYRYATSVEQEVAPAVRAAMEGDEALFHGAGREDVDARMLGTGRPFVVEVKHPRRRSPDVDALTVAINDASDAVEVEGLRLATHEMVERVKELDASKRYRAEVEFDAPVTADGLAEALAELDGATVEQYTPERVDHRRASKTRTREVYETAGELTDETHATVEVHGAGGLYVKELVSGDDGRTTPSLAGLLGVGAEVTALDVLAVEGEEEPFEDEAFFRNG